MSAPAPATLKQAAPEELTHLRPNERAALREYLDRLRARFGDRILRVILYGSRARGEGDEESDLDVLVVVDGSREDWRFAREVSMESFDPSLAHNVCLSPMIIHEEEYAQLQKWGVLFYRKLEQDGIPLWTERQSKR